MNSIGVTREGKRFLVASSLIAVAAFNTGNNLIYLIFSLMFSLLVLSVVLARINLSGLSLDIGNGRAVFAGEETSLSLLLKNRKHLMPSYSLKCHVSGSAVPACFDIIPALKGIEKNVTITFPRRGTYNYGAFHIASGFPFVLLNALKNIEVSGSVLVYPGLRDVSAGIDQMASYGEAEASRPVDAGDDLYALRKFREGDDWRRIHWKASAKRQMYFVKEYAEFTALKVTIFLDNRLPEDGELFERTVSLAASFANDYLARGYYVSVVTCGKTIPFGIGSEHLFNILDVLALIAEEDDCENHLEEPTEGVVVTVFKRRETQRRRAPTGDLVFYAEDL